MAEILPIIMYVAKDISPGRLFESMTILFLLWRGVKAHLMKIETRLKGVEDAVREGFKDGETRFQVIEGEIKEVKSRVTVLETTKA